MSDDTRDVTLLLLQPLTVLHGAYDNDAPPIDPWSIVHASPCRAQSIIMSVDAEAEELRSFVRHVVVIGRGGNWTAATDSHQPRRSIASSLYPLLSTCTPSQHRHAPPSRLLYLWPNAHRTCVRLVRRHAGLQPEVRYYFLFNTRQLSHI